MALGIFDYIFGENRFKQGDSGSDPTDYGLLDQATQPDYLKQGVDYMAKGFGNLYDTAKDVQLLGGISDLGRVAENYQRRFRGQEVIPPTEPEFITNYRNRVENIPRPKYDTEKGGFQGILGGEEGADRFIAENVLGGLEMLNRPVAMGEMLSNVAVGGIGNLTGTDIDPYYQEIASEMGKEIASDFDSWDAFNKSLMESPDTPAMVLGGATYGGLKMLQLYKTNPKFQNAIKESFENAKNPGLSIKDISARTQDEITAPINYMGFYNPIQQLLMDLPQEVNTGADVKRYLLKRGVKRDQISEMGLDDYLKNKKEVDNDRVTKEGLLSFVDKNRVRLDEMSLMGGYGTTGLKLDRPNEEFDQYSIRDGQYYNVSEHFSNEANRNPTDRNWEALNDEQYIESLADDFMHDWEGSTYREMFDMYGQAAMIKQIHDVDPELYRLDWANLDLDTKVPESLLRKIAEADAKESYWDNPVYEWKVKTPDGDEYKVVGNEDYGFTITAPNGTVVNKDDLVYSIDEAEVVLNEHARDYDYVFTGDGEAEYFDYQGAAHEEINPATYEEVLIQDAGEHGFYGDHFSNYEDVLAHVRMGDVKDGTRKKVIEIQSDLHQQGRQKGYYTPEVKAQHDKLKEERLPVLKQEQSKNKNRQELVEKKYEDATHNLEVTVEGQGMDVDVQMPTGMGDYLHAVQISSGPLELHFMDGKLSRISQMGKTKTKSSQLDEGIPVDKYVPFIGEWELKSPEQIAQLPIKKEWQPILKQIEEVSRLGKERKDLQYEWAKITTEMGGIQHPGYVPDAPLKNERWIQRAVEMSIERARREGKEGVEFVDSEFSLDIWNPNRRLDENGKVRYQELYQNVYDKKVPSVLKKYKNKYGGEIEKLEGGGYYYKFDEKSRNVKGVPLASTGGLLSIDQMQDDDKMNNKQGLLA